MSVSRRPRAGRPAARRPAGARAARAARPSRPSAGARVARSAPPARTGSPLTTRAALLGLVVCTLVVSAVLPLRTFLEQRGRIADLEREQAAAQERVAGLEHAKAQLQDPAFIAAEARRRLHMARPGEVSYVLITPSPAPAPSPEAEPRVGGPEAPWWSQVLAGVEAADRSGAPPAPAPTPSAPAPAPAPAAPAPAPAPTP